MELYGTEEEQISDSRFTENTLFMIGFGLFTGFVDNKKNTEYHQSYPLKWSNTWRHDGYLCECHTPSCAAT